MEGIVCYNEFSKIKRLGVSKEYINKYSTVSRQVASQMAIGVKKFLDADIGISTTGVAGPKDFDSYENPKGLFYIGIAMNDYIKVFRFKETGTRDEIREKACLFAIAQCLFEIENEPSVN